MEKGVLVCGVDKNREFDCTLDDKKIEIHEIKMKNGAVMDIFTKPEKALRDFFHFLFD